MAAHAAAAAAVYMVLPTLAGAALAAALIALGAAAARSRALLRAAASIRVVELAGTQATFELEDGSKVAVSLGARRYVSRALVLLPYRPTATAGRLFGRTLLVTADMLDAGEFRRLRIWALWNRLPGVAAAQLAG